MSFGLIDDRDSFRKVLADAQARTARILQARPQDTTFGKLSRQLAEMDTSTKNGRDPTRDERKHVDLGLVVVRELDPIEDIEVSELAERLHMLGAYYDEWPPTKKAGDTPPWLPEGDDDGDDGEDLPS